MLTEGNGPHRTLSCPVRDFVEGGKDIFCSRVKLQYMIPEECLYAPALFCGVSRLSWLDPFCASWVMGTFGSAEYVGSAGAGAAKAATEVACNERWTKGRDPSETTERPGEPGYSHRKQAWPSGQTAD